MASQAGVVKLASLIDTVVAPKQGERMLFLTDFGEKSDDQAKQRMDLVLRWHQASQLLSKEKSFRLLPIVVYKETGKNNSELPKSAETIDGGHVDDLPSLIASCNIAIAMTKYSASAPLKNLASSASSLRAVSMPGV
ncbi:MAG: hypothetical protein QW275_03725 [Candidatus Anstonellaceae archaeon]